MVVGILRRFALALALLPSVAMAEPIVLKLAFFSSDRTHLYLSGIKPFVDAVNAEGAGRVRIDVYFGGQLGRDLSKQSQLALDGAADIVHVVPPYERTSFPDASVIELPGIFKDAAEATHVSAQLIESGIIRGFADYFVIGVFPGEPESIHTRPPVAMLADLKGKRIRVSNESEAELLKKFGATPVLIPLYDVANAISRGTVDGAMAPPVPLMEFGIARVTTNHYFLRTSCVAQVLMMTRKRFSSLPADVQAIVRKYSGGWFIDNYISINDASTALVMNQIEADTRRKVVLPSPADMKTAEIASQSIVDGYAAATPHNGELVRAMRDALMKFRSVP
jgi:TRAP-type C4-dicarboxylate transport system substrate-binding protein